MFHIARCSVCVVYVYENVQHVGRNAYFFLLAADITSYIPVHVQNGGSKRERLLNSRGANDTRHPHDCPIRASPSPSTGEEEADGIPPARMRPSHERKRSETAAY